MLFFIQVTHVVFIFTQSELELLRQSSQTATIDDLMKDLIAEKDREIEQLTQSLQETGAPTSDQVSLLSVIIVP